MTQASNADSTPTQDNSDRSYTWADVAMHLSIHWFAPDEPGQPRQVMLSVTTYDDAPIARLVLEEPLEHLLPQLQAMLTELEQSLAIRQMQWQQRASKQTRKPTASRPQTTTSSPTPTVSSTQIALF